MADIKKFLDTTALGTLVEQIKAEDAKVLAAAKKYTDDAGKLYDVAGAAATAESNAKAYTDELANGQVKTNKEAIATLNGDVNTAGSVAKAIADAKALIDIDVDAVEEKADKNAEDIAAINHETTGILAVAKKYTDDEAAKVQGNVDDLAEYVGTIPETATATNIVGYIQEKTSGIATEGAMTELSNRVDVVEGDVATIKSDYLKAADKTELEGKIGVVQTAVDTEKSRAEGIEAGLRTDVDVIKGDYLKAADKTELQGNIDTVAGAVELLTNGVDADKVDGVNDLLKYVEEHGTEVTGMQEDIADNAEAIEGVADRVTVNEGKIADLETASALHADKTYVDEQVQALQGADTAIKGRLDVLEAAIGESGSVAEDIEAARQAAVEEAASMDTALETKITEAYKKYADEEDAKIESRVGDLEAASATHALASDVTTLAGRVTVNEGAISALGSDLDAAKGRITVNEGAITTINSELTKKALQTDLESAVGRIAVNEGAITTLNGAVATKAENAALEAAVERIAANETAIAANASAIGAFTPITSEEVVALFA